MSVSSKRGNPLPGEEKSSKPAEHSPLKPRLSLNAKKNGNVKNGTVPESDLSAYAPGRDRTPSVDLKKSISSSAYKTTAKSRADALMSRRVTGSATSVRTPAGKGPRRSTSSDLMQIENGCVGSQSQDQADSALPTREASSTSSCSSSGDDERGLRVKRAVSREPSRKSSLNTSKTPPTVRRKYSPSSTENVSRFQRQSSSRSSQNGKQESPAGKPPIRAGHSSSIDNGFESMQGFDAGSAESRQHRIGTTKGSSQDSGGDPERKTKSALSRTPTMQRKLCMEIVMEKKIISKSNGSLSSIGTKLSPKQTMSSPTDENVHSTRSSPTRPRLTTHKSGSIPGSDTGARMKVRVTASSEKKQSSPYSQDKSRVASAPVPRRADQSLPSVVPSGPMRAMSGSVRSSVPKVNLKSPDRASRILHAAKQLATGRSRARARSVEPVTRNAGVLVTPGDSGSTAGPDQGGTLPTSAAARARRSQSVERKSNKDSLVASRRQVWEDKACQSPADAKKATSLFPEKKLHRLGLGRRSLIDERKAMLFGGSVRNPAKENARKPPSPSKLEINAAKPPMRPPARAGPQREATIELHIDEELPQPAGVAAVATSPPVATSPSVDVVAKPAVLQENVQMIQPNTINVMSRPPLSTDEVDSTRRYSPTKENEIISILSFDKKHLAKTAGSHQENTSDRRDLLKENQCSSGDRAKKGEELSWDNETASRQQAHREMETSNHNKQINAATLIQDCVAEIKDGYYFQRMVNEEQCRIEALSTRANKYMEKELSEEVSGKLRASIGKAYLLTNKKFKQFRGLCEQNINPSDDDALPVTDLDLAGFWDMVMLQVGDVNCMFEEIESFRQNGWRTPKNSPKKLRATGKKPSLTSPPPSPGIYKPAVNPLADPKQRIEREKKAAKARQARDEARKRLMAAKRAAARKRVKSEDGETPIEIFVPDKQ